MANVTKSVIAAGGGDYTTVAAAEAASDVSSGWYKIEIQDNSTYDENVTISGSTGTDSVSNYVWLTVAAANRHSGQFSGTHARLSNAMASANVLTVSDSYTRVEWLHLQKTGATNSSYIIVHFSLNPTACMLSHCLVNVATSGVTVNALVTIQEAYDTRIDNCALIDDLSACLTVRTSSGSIRYVYVDNCTIGIISLTATTWTGYRVYMHMYNTACYKTIAEDGSGGLVRFYGSNNLRTANITLSGNATNDATSWQYASSGVATVAKTSGSWYLVTANSTGDSADFSLLDDTAYNLAAGNGIDRISVEPDPRQDFSVDVAGVTRLTTGVDIGAYVYVVSSVDYTDTPADALGLADTITPAIGWARSPSGLAGLIDTANQVSTTTRDAADIAGITDTPDGATASTRSVFDLDALADNLIPASDNSRTGADTAGLVDVANRASSSARTSSDAVDLADTLAAALAATRAVAGVVDLVDAATAGLGFSRTAADPLDVVDAAARMAAATRLPADPIGIADAVALSLGKTISDLVGVADTASKILAFGRTIQDPVDVVDTAARVVAAARPPAELIGLSDAQATVAALVRVAADPLDIYDIAATAAGVVKAIADSLDVADAAAIAAAATRAVNELLALADSTSASLGLTRIPADSLGLADTPSQATAATRIPADTLDLADAATRAAGLARTATDLVGIVDSITDVLARQIAAAIADSLGITDTAAILGLVDIIRAYLSSRQRWTVTAGDKRWATSIGPQRWRAVKGDL